MSASCIILAGGLGTRLKDAVPDLPKCLAPISGRPFLAWQLNSLAERGIKRFVLALGHGSQLVLNALNEKWAKAFVIEVVIEPESLGTGGAAAFAMDQLNFDEALIANGDTFLGGNLDAMLLPLDLASGEMMRMATVQVTDRTRFGGVVVDTNNRVTDFVEKRQSGTGAINAGLYRIHRRAFDWIEECKFSMETQLMPCLVGARALHSRELAGPFIDIGIPEDYKLFDARALYYTGQALGGVY